MMLLDGHNNPGFSGGPVFFTSRDDQLPKVAGVISGFRYNWEPIFLQGQPTDLSFQYNTGIIVAWSIAHAVEIINGNPIGAPAG